MKHIFTFILLFSGFLFSQSVVVNKYFNSGVTSPSGSGDAVELLVIQNNLDMRGMLLKDFSSSMANDGGGKFEFTQSSLWQTLKAGTLIILRTDNSEADTDPADFKLDIGLKNATYFTLKGGTFDIATTEMVMIKAAGSDTTGTVGSIHALAGGTAGTQFNNAPEPKLRSTTTSAGGKYIIAKNSTSTLADFNGLDATTDSTGIVLGQGNNATNTTYINQLRGGVTLNTTVQFSQSGQTVNRNAGTVKVTVSINNPSATNATTVNAALTGGTGVNGVDIQNYTTQNLNFPANSPVSKTFDVVVNNITTTQNKTIIFTLQNPAGGTNATLGTQTQFTLTILGTQVDTSVVVPISQLRNNNSNGEPVEANKYFTIAGVVSVANEINSPSYIQDNTAGIAVFARGAGLFSASVKIGDSVKVKGRLTQFRGLTQLDSVKSFTILDSNRTVTPRVVTIPEILNQQWNGFEQLEGLLLKVNNVRTDSVGVFLGNTNYNVYNGTDTFQIRITNGTFLVGQNIPSGPFNVVGALGQFKSAAPYSGGYQLLLRVPGDVQPVSAVGDDATQRPVSVELYNNYPNPFNPSTTISFSIPKEDFVSLNVYNLLGEKVSTLLNGKITAGKHSIKFDAAKLHSGIYLYSLKSGNTLVTKKMIYLK